VVVGLKFHPKLGEIVLCSFPASGRWHHDEALKGEMVKDRLVIVVSRKLAGRANLANVVPISMTPPNPAHPWHVEIPSRCIPSAAAIARQGARFAKCDMVCTVAIARLSYCNAWGRVGAKGPSSTRPREPSRLDIETLRKIRRALASVFEIDPTLFPYPKPKR
jgi:mRNA interferase MazF